MSLHPEERPQSVEQFHRALLGDWKPSPGSRSYLPRPTLGDVIASSVERRLLWVAGSLFLLSLIATISGLG